jgi:DNA-binding response OmpR family regulator
MPLAITELLPTLWRVFQWVRTHRQPRFLIVEDNLEDAFFLQRTVEHAGCFQVTANSAEMAEGMLRQGKFDYVLLDMRFTGMSGMELLLRILRENPVQVIILTCGEPQDLVAIPKSKLIHCVAKPITAEVIRDILKYLKA